MGSCISKCRPNKSSPKQCNFVQDKLVISQAPTTPAIPPSKEQPYSHFPSPSSSSFSCTNTVTTGSYSLSSQSSLSSSCSSSISKDRSFSNEFLWSCIKENPHIILVDSIKVSPLKSVPVKFPTQNFKPPSKSIVAPSKQLIVPRHVESIPQKRARDMSPSLARQKSFRREPQSQGPHPTSSLPRRNLGYSSPSRRINGDVCSGNLRSSSKESCNREFGSKSNDVPIMLSTRKENFQTTASPSNNLNWDCSRSRKRETCTHHIHPEVDQNSVGEVLSNQDFNSLSIDDIDNPLISLDCFIFL